MWIYYQATGNLLHNFAFQEKGYSGRGKSKDSPVAQSIRFEGPIPRGIYTINNPIDSSLTGPYSIPLSPSGYNEMFGRSAFLIHGDSEEHPGDASDGCIVMSRPTRELIIQSQEKLLAVV